MRAGDIEQHIPNPAEGSEGVRVLKSSPFNVASRRCSPQVV
jgi:hypothetical protein